jgi:hypothetical protein
MELSSCDCGASAPSTNVPRTAQKDSSIPCEKADVGLNVGWTGLLPWLGAGLSPTSLVEESDR